MKLVKLFSLAILIFSVNTAIVSAQENSARENEVELAQKLMELQSNYEFLNGQINRKMSKEQEEKILTKLQPEIKNKMEEIKKLDNDKYYQLLNSLKFGNSFGYDFTEQGVSWHRSSTMKEDLKKEKLLEIDVQLLTLKYKNANKASKSKIKKDLTAALSDMFDIREAKKQKEVEQLETRLQKLNESLKARKQNKDIIIERRIQELLGDSKYLEW